MKWVIEITPTPAPRTTQKIVKLLKIPEGKRRISKQLETKVRQLKRYLSYKTNLQMLASLAGVCLANGMSITFYMPMPKSWSKNKKANYKGTPHEQTPDLDNFYKAFADALLRQDSKIYKLNGLAKYWSPDINDRIGEVEIIDDSYAGATKVVTKEGKVITLSRYFNNK